MDAHHLSSAPHAVEIVDEGTLRSLLGSPSSGAVVIDCRDPQEISAGDDALAGHVNIPWRLFPKYEARLQHLHDIVPSKDAPVVVYGEHGGRSEAMKIALSKCGFSNVYNASGPKYIYSALPDLSRTGVPSPPAEYPSNADLHELIVVRGALVIDARDAAEIERDKDAFEGHINIPWSSFAQMRPLIEFFGDSILGRRRDDPVVVHCMRGRRAGLLKEALERHCGFTNVYNGENPQRIHESCPELVQTSSPKPMSSFACPEHIRDLVGKGARIVDVREPEEIASAGDGIEGHINIPLSSFNDFASRLASTYCRELLGSKHAPLLIHCRAGRRAATFIELLGSRCGYVNLFNAENPARILKSCPELKATNVPNTLSPYLTPLEIRELVVHNALLLDAREPEEITAAGDGIDGHINIPWSSFGEYASRLKEGHDVLGPKGTPIIVFCRSGRRAEQFKTVLEKVCGYTQVFNGKSSQYIREACPELPLTSGPHAISSFASQEDLRRVLLPLVDSSADAPLPLLIDCREPEEIISSKDGLEKHVNIPWSTFPHKGSMFFKDLHGHHLSKDPSRPIVIYCLKGWRSGYMKRILDSLGYTNVYNAENSRRIKEACPELEFVDAPNSMC
jgi:rhodanese-related sulfurtransferase